jgi:hypothetical protein
VNGKGQANWHDYNNITPGKTQAFRMEIMGKNEKLNSLHNMVCRFSRSNSMITVG